MAMRKAKGPTFRIPLGSVSPATSLLLHQSSYPSLTALSTIPADRIALRLCTPPDLSDPQPMPNKPTPAIFPLLVVRQSVFSNLLEPLLPVADPRVQKMFLFPNPDASKAQLCMVLRGALRESEMAAHYARRHFARNRSSKSRCKLAATNNLSSIEQLLPSLYSSAHQHRAHFHRLKHQPHRRRSDDRATRKPRRKHSDRPFRAIFLRKVMRHCQRPRESQDKKSQFNRLHKTGCDSRPRPERSAQNIYSQTCQCGLRYRNDRQNPRKEVKSVMRQPHPQPERSKSVAIAQRHCPHSRFSAAQFAGRPSR